MSILITILGSGAGTAVIGWFFQRKFAHQLEIQKSFLYRASQVHQRQLEVLSKLYGHFTEVRDYLQLMQKAIILAGEKPEEYPKFLAGALEAARNELTFGRLLIPDSIAAQCDAIFARVFQSQQDHAFARDPLLQDVQARLKLNDNATEISYKLIPAMLQSIEGAARTIIHGENPVTTSGKE